MRFFSVGFNFPYEEASNEGRNFQSLQNLELFQLYSLLISNSMKL